MSKQSAVQWLIEQLRSLSHSLEAHLGMGDIRVTQGMIDDLEEKAKQMEKQQILNELKLIGSYFDVSKLDVKEISHHIRFTSIIQDRINHYNKIYGK